MIYGKIVDNVLEFAPPEIYTEDNIVIELRTYDDYIENGYKPIVTKKPIYDKNKYDLLYTGFIESEILITLQYELREKVVDSVLEMLNEIYNEEINK